MSKRKRVKKREREFEGAYIVHSTALPASVISYPLSVMLSIQ